MGAAIYYTLFEGIMSVVDPKFHDYFVPRAFDITLTCAVAFAGIGTFGIGVFYQWRRHGAKGNASFIKLLWDQFKWVPLSTLFYASVLFHVTEVCFIYFFSMKVVWGATAKESAKKNCFTSLRETLVAYKWEYMVNVLLLLGYSVCLWYFQISMYRGWSVMSYSIGHILGPILLNPRIMALQW